MPNCPQKRPNLDKYKQRLMERKEDKVGNFIYRKVHTKKDNPVKCT